MRLPGILLALRAEAGALQAVAEGVVHCAEQVVRQHAPGLAIGDAPRPLDAGVGEQRVVGDVEIAAAEAGLGGEDPHHLVGPQVAHGVPRVALVRVVGLVEEVELVARFLERAVLRRGLLDQVGVGRLDLRVLRRVRHGLVGRRDAARTLLIDADVLALATQPDAARGGVALGYFDEPGVWPGRAFNSWRTRERRKASALTPSASVSLC